MGLLHEPLNSPTIYPDLLMRVRFDERLILPVVATEIWNARRVHASLLTRAKSSNGIYKVTVKTSTLTTFQYRRRPPGRTR